MKQEAERRPFRAVRLIQNALETNAYTMSSNRPGMSRHVTAATEIREASVADAAAIETAYFASREAAYGPYVSEWPPDGPGREERTTRRKLWLSDTGIHCLVAERRSEILGFATVHPASDSDVPPDETSKIDEGTPEAFTSDRYRLDLQAGRK